MLTALELVGFKSFADRTRFEFPDGITVVVGPNGSGKSNIVDAIKWVLGSQSAKALRGGDMADVIFKGSATSNRKPSNSAEATLLFDNAQSLLQVDASEVAVTRRVYRSGESEYLINNEPCRLKDIRDLFRGTGVGVDAYSLIEQGKVDRMLQASPRDRRAIFEEAAGISRFKAKKIEAERRLGRVEQGLTRLRDIVDEVGTRLATLKSQADKARRYREMTLRLAELRTQLGFFEKQEIEASRESVIETIKSLEAAQQEHQEQLSLAKQNGLEIESEISELNDKVGEARRHLEEDSQSLTVLKANVANTQVRLTELQEEHAKLDSRLAGYEQKAELSNTDVATCQNQLADLNAHLHSQTDHVERLRQLHDQASNEFETSQQSKSELQAELHRHQAAINELARSQASAQSRLEAGEQSIATLEEQLEAAKEDHVELLTNLEQSRAAKHEKQLELDEAQSVLQQVESQIDDAQLELKALQEQSVALAGRLQGVRERMAVLQQLESAQEGVAQGARRLIDLAQRQQIGAWESVLGKVADLLEIDMHLAPLIDVALGGVAETVVLSDGAVIRAIQTGELEIEGRVSMLRMDRLTSNRSAEKIQLDGLNGVIGRADRLVQCEIQFEPLVRHVLGNTWLVDTLDTALDLAHLRGAGLKFVTASCERINPDGTLVLGSLQSALGLVSRRSELLAAKTEIQHLTELTQESSRGLLNVQERIAQLENQRNEAKSHLELIRSQSNELALEHSALEQRSQQIEQSVERLDTQIERYRDQASKFHVEIASLAALHTTESEAIAKLQNAIASTKATVSEIAIKQKQANEEWSVAKIGMAKVEQQVESLEATLAQLSRDADERIAAVRETKQMLVENEGKQEVARKFLEQAIAQDTALQSRRDAHQLFLNQQETILSEKQQKRDEHGQLLNGLHRKIDQQSEKLHQCREGLDSLHEKLQSHVQHFLAEYQIDLLDAELAEKTGDCENREQAVNEAGELRQAIASVGAVNMEALAELDELQSRFDTLDGHYRDLVESKESLLKVIAKINQDSRRMFVETLDAIRENFQTLYRRSFGGGSADIILEEGEDVLESGVEIIATPPGKTSLSNSLLSGGERALTAVALIMAIFQFRPSPFCILDEVDAPFDEANIGRFVSVLREFLDSTKFIVVTHSKKTMTAANTLYGVTMQESGVSKQVSVRFEDVTDDGQILPKAA